MKNNKQFYDFIDHELRKEKGQTIFEYTANDSNGIFHLAIAVIAVGTSHLGLVNEDNSVGLVFYVITAVSWFTARRYFRVIMYMKPLITAHEAREKEREQTQTNSKRQNYDDFADNGAANDGFGFNTGRFGAKPPPPQPDENAPRGYEKRHPDDAKFWAFVDDPETPENEAISAYRQIRKNEKERRKRGLPPPN